MTALDIIKSLPIETKLKTQIINMYDYMEPEEKLSIDRLAWKTYDAVYNEKLVDTLGSQFSKAKEGKEELDQDFYKRALKKTDEEMTGQLQESLSTTNLALARHAMEQIMQEIHASKQAKKKVQQSHN